MTPFGIGSGCATWPKRAGVAPSTASAVLNGRADEARIAPPTQERVRAAAAELGYRPNLAARNLRSHTSRIVGLVSDAIAAEPYAGEMVRGAYASALTHDRLLVIAETDGSRTVEDDLVRGMLDRQIDGLVYGCLSTRARAAVGRGHRAAGRAPQLPGRSRCRDPPSSRTRSAAGARRPAGCSRPGTATGST